MSARWIQVTWPAKDAVFAIATDGGKVTQAPPIARWALGEDERRVAAWLRDKGATFAPMPETPATAHGLDPGARFYCEICGGMQTIPEIRQCRDGGS